MTISEFLLARLLDDEKDVLCVEKELGRWERERAMNGRSDGSQGSILATALRDSAADPQRMLREIEAKRQLVRLHGGAFYGGATRDGRHECVGWWQPFEDDPPRTKTTLYPPCETLKTLADAYNDHPDYQPEWALVGASR